MSLKELDKYDKPNDVDTIAMFLEVKSILEESGIMKFDSDGNYIVQQLHDHSNHYVGVGEKYIGKDRNLLSPEKELEKEFGKDHKESMGKIDDEIIDHMNNVTPKDPNVALIHDQIRLIQKLKKDKNVLIELLIENTQYSQGNEGSGRQKFTYRENLFVIWHDHKNFCHVLNTPKDTTDSSNREECVGDILHYIENEL